MIDFEEMLSHEDEERPMPLPEAIIARMQEAAPRYTGACQFCVGDIVTVRIGGVIRHDLVGIPAVVISVDNALPMNWASADDGYGSTGFAARVNMRVLQYFVHDDSIVPKWVDSAEYELFSDYQLRLAGKEALEARAAGGAQ